jgi:chaperonin GroES
LVVRREDSEDRTEGGIYLPESAKNKPTRGTVVSIGDGRLLDDGSRAPMQVKPGDRVLFTSYAGETIEIGDEEFILMGEGELLAVIE